MTTTLKNGKHISDLAREIERLVARGELWPGFDPLAIPLAFYDGEYTYLFRYPGVPEGFAEMRVGKFDVLVYNGRHPAAVASSIIDISGTPTAGVILDRSSANRTTTVLASLAIHEAFHR